MISLDDIIQRLSLQQVDINFSSAESPQDASNRFFEQITQDLATQIPTFSSEVEELTKDLFFCKNDEEREDHQMELITVFSIIKTINHIDLLLDEPLTTDSARKINALLLSFTPLLKYHFQLPVNHKNYGMCHFGRLLTSEKHNIITPFIKYFKKSAATFGEINKIEILEKTLILNCTLSCLNNEMFGFLKSYFSNEDQLSQFTQTLSLNLNSKHDIDCYPSLFSFLLRFRSLSLLEDSSLANDSKSTNLLNILFYSSFHKPFLKNMINVIIKFTKILSNKLDSESLLQLSMHVLMNPKDLDYLTVLFIGNINILDNTNKLDGPEYEKSEDIATFLLLKISQNYLLYYNTIKLPNREVLSFLDEYNNTSYTSILGMNDINCIPELNISTLVPIFEFYDQNFKLDYTNERDFLTLLNLALVNIDLNLNSDNDFMNLSSLLIDLGCSKSMHALFDTIQSLLCCVLNDMKFGSTYFNKIPLQFREVLGFENIPPVYRSATSLENNIDAQAENFGATFNLLRDIENYPVMKEAKSIELLEHALLLTLSIKSKVYKFMKELNSESNVLRVPDLFTDETKHADYQINAFKQGISTKIASFKSRITANLCLLTLSENYKMLKSSNSMIDTSVSRFLSEFTFDFTLNLILIYQEFGLLTLFKRLRELNYMNLNLIIPSSSLIAKLFQAKNNDSKDSESNTEQFQDEASGIELITDILKKSVMASNLLRQFVEIFDDGQSKPFKSLNKFLKANPSTLKPSKISKGTVTLDLNYYTNVLY